MCASVPTLDFCSESLGHWHWDGCVTRIGGVEWVGGCVVVVVIWERGGVLVQLNVLDRGHVRQSCPQTEGTERGRGGE